MLWQYKGQIHLLDTRGRTIPVRDLGPFLDLPLLLGKRVDKNAAAFLKDLKQSPAIFERVESLLSSVNAGGT